MGGVLEIIGVSIAYLGGGAFVVLAFSSWLGKLWAKRIIGEEIAKLQHEHKLTEIAYSIKFARLHSKRAEVIAEIYSLLSEVENQSRLLATPLVEPEEPPKSETYKKTADIIYKLFETYSKYRIYLNEESCLKLDKFIQDSKLPLSLFKVVKQANSQDPNAEDPVLQNKMKEKFMDVWEEVETKVPDARRAVELEFRKILDGTT